MDDIPGTNGKTISVRCAAETCVATGTSALFPEFFEAISLTVVVPDARRANGVRRETVILDRAGAQALYAALGRVLEDERLSDWADGRDWLRDQAMKRGVGVTHG